MAQLVLSVAQDTSNVNLTALGETDWASWADNPASLTPSDHKSGGGSLISAALFGGGTQSRYSDDARTFSWTDGTNEGSSANTIGMYNDAAVEASGFEVTFPADTTIRIAQLYLGHYACNARVTAIISDGSTGNQVDSTTLAGADGVFFMGRATVTYAAASPGQTLKIRVEVLTSLGGSRNVAIAAAALGLPSGTPGSASGAGVAATASASTGSASSVAVKLTGFRLIDKLGAPVTSESGITALIHKSVPSSLVAPDKRIANVTTNGSGTLMDLDISDIQSDATPVWLSLMKQGSPSKGVTVRVTPVVS